MINPIPPGAPAGDSTANEETVGGRPAFLFRNGDWAGITLDSSGLNLPREPNEWTLVGRVTVGVRDAMPINVTPEQVIRGLRAEGYCVWRTNDPSRTVATAQ